MSPSAYLTQIRPARKADAPVDLEDFDDDILDGEDLEKLFLPPNVPDTVK